MARSSHVSTLGARRGEGFSHELRMMCVGAGRTASLEPNEDACAEKGNTCWADKNYRGSEKLNKLPKAAEL